jgi:hypothetical protein
MTTNIAQIHHSVTLTIIYIVRAMGQDQYNNALSQHICSQGTLGCPNPQARASMEPGIEVFWPLGFTMTTNIAQIYYSDHNTVVSWFYHDNQYCSDLLL